MFALASRYFVLSLSYLALFCVALSLAPYLAISLASLALCCRFCVDEGRISHFSAFLRFLLRILARLTSRTRARGRDLKKKAPRRKRLEEEYLGKEEIILNLTAAQQAKLQIILPSTRSHVLPATGRFVRSPTF
jgi:hypothetical protein